MSQAHPVVLAHELHRISNEPNRVEVDRAEDARRPVQPVTLSVVPDRIGRALMLAVVAMTVASAAAQAIRRHVASEDLRELLRLFKLSDENTIPTFFSAIMLLACGALLGVIERMTKRRRCRFARHWAALAVIFVYLAIDEAVAIHELANEPLRRALHAGGFLHYPWVILGMMVVAILGVVYWPLVMHLRPRVRWQVMLSAAVYVGGAVGMEMVGAKIASTVGTGTVWYALEGLVEEFMEMTGTVLFFHALLLHLANQANVLHVALPTKEH